MKLGFQIAAQSLGCLTMLGCCIIFGGTSIRVEQGTKYCTILQFPRPLNEAQPGNSYSGLHYEFRRPPNSPDEVVFTLAEDLVEPGPFNVYRFALSRPTQIKVSTQQEWKKGTPIAEVPKGGEVIQHLLDGTAPASDRVATTDMRIFRYSGHKLEKSGDLWEPYRPVLLSPEKGYVALQSWNGRMGGKTSGDGPFFVDIYQLSNGKRIALLRGD